MSDFHQIYIDLESRKEQIKRTLERIPRSGTTINGAILVKIDDVAEVLAKEELGFYK